MVRREDGGLADMRASATVYSDERDGGMNLTLLYQPSGATDGEGNDIDPHVDGDDLINRIEKKEPEYNWRRKPPKRPFFRNFVQRGAKGAFYLRLQRGKVRVEAAEFPHNLCCHSRAASPLPSTYAKAPHTNGQLVKLDATKCTYELTTPPSGTTVGQNTGAGGGCTASPSACPPWYWHSRWCKPPSGW